MVNIVLDSTCGDDVPTRSIKLFEKPGNWSFDLRANRRPQKSLDGEGTYKHTNINMDITDIVTTFISNCCRFWKSKFDLPSYNHLVVGAAQAFWRKWMSANVVLRTWYVKMGFHKKNYNLFILLGLFVIYCFSHKQNTISIKS